MAMNPRVAANAKGCIDSVTSFTKTMLLPHVPEMTIRFAHSLENAKFPMRVPKINFSCFDGESSQMYSTQAHPRYRTSSPAAHDRRSMEKALGRLNTIDSHYQTSRRGAIPCGGRSSRFVWATVMSRPAEDRAIVDAGLKAQLTRNSRNLAN